MAKNSKNEKGQDRSSGTTGNEKGNKQNTSGGKQAQEQDTPVKDGATNDGKKPGGNKTGTTRSR